MRVTIDEQKIRQLVTSPAGPVVKQVNQITRRTANAARTLSPVNTGLLRNSVHESLEVRGYRIVGRVYDDAPYARYVHQGTRYMRGRPFLVRALQQASPWPIQRL